MNLNPKQLRAKAQAAIDGASYSSRRLVAINAAVVLVLSLVLSGLDYFLNQSIGSTGGLSGISTRAVLETLRSLLQMTNMLVLPFWQMGLLFVMLRTARRQTTGPRQLLAGFSIFGPVLRLNVLRAVIYFLVMMIAGQVASSIFILTPWAEPMLELMDQMAGATDPTALLTDELLMSLATTLVPMMVAIALVLLVPVMYRLRLMEYCLLDAPQAGAFKALAKSLQLTRKQSLRLLKLDLSFWWFYVLNGLTVAVCFGDLLLPLLGVQLPVDAALVSFGFYALGMALQLGLYVWKQDLLEVTFAQAYESLLPPPEIETVML